MIFKALGKPIDVTVGIPVKNDVTALRRCLEQLGRFKYVYVIDSGSTDGTAELVEEFRVNLVEFNWNGKYPKKRNWFLLNHEFKTDWVLFLDADEVVNDAFCNEVSDAIQSSSYDGYVLSFSNWFLGKYLRHGDYLRKLALFRVESGLYERIDEDKWSQLDMEIHEHPVLNGPVGEISALIHHEDMRGRTEYVQKHNEYAKWEAQRYIALTNGPDESWKRLTRRQQLKYRSLDKRWFSFAYFLISYFYKRGFLDGYAGFEFARLKYQYFNNIRVLINQSQKSQKLQGSNKL